MSARKAQQRGHDLPELVARVRVVALGLQGFPPGNAAQNQNAGVQVRIGSEGSGEVGRHAVKQGGQSPMIMGTPQPLIAITLIAARANSTWAPACFHCIFSFPLRPQRFAPI